MTLEIESEIKIDSDGCVAAWDNILFVGTEDGHIQTFDANLSPVTSWKAHEVQVFALAAGDGKVYSASNDCGVRVWTPDGEKIAELPSTGSDVGVLRIFGKHLYTGDEIGNVVVYEELVEKARYNLLEEVKDLDLNGKFLYTVRDLDVTVTEISPDSSKVRFLTRHTMEGRAPLRVIGDSNHLVVMARDGCHLRLHDATVDTKFKKLYEVKASDMIITSVAESGGFVWIGGWDGHVRRWKITSSDHLEAVGDLDLSSCVNALVAIASDKAFVITAGGKVICVKAT